MRDLNVDMYGRREELACAIKIRLQFDMPEEMVDQLGKMLGRTFNEWLSGIMLHEKINEPQHEK